MNKRIDLTKTDGFPYTQDMLDFMQQSYRDAFGAIANSLGPLVIVTGVDDLGAAWGSGWVSIAGELMPFIGGTKAARVIVTETTGTEVFEDTVVETVYFTKQAVLAGAGGNAFADFVRLKTNAQIKTDLDTLFSGKADRNQIAWQNFSLNTPWILQGHQPRFRKNEFGEVAFAGGIASNGVVIGAPNRVITTLPLGFRPLNQVSFSLLNFDGANYVTNRLSVNSTGAVLIVNASGTVVDDLKLDTVRFYID
jgi:hypothetical protein